MKIVVIGNAGQLSYELVRILGEDTTCLVRK
jgi:dTDP-4-dehydrorhamnose reductase